MVQKRSRARERGKYGKYMPLYFIYRMTSSGEGVKEIEESVDQDSEGFQHFQVREGGGARKKRWQKKKAESQEKNQWSSVPLRSFLLKRKLQKCQVNSGLQMDLWIKWWKLLGTLERKVLTSGSGV